MDSIFRVLGSLSAWISNCFIQLSRYLFWGQNKPRPLTHQVLEKNTQQPTNIEGQTNIAEFPDKIEDMKKVRFSREGSDNEGGSDHDAPLHSEDSVIETPLVNHETENKPANENSVDSDSANEQGIDDGEVDDTAKSINRLESQLRKKNEHIRRLTDKVNLLEEEGAQLRNGVRINGSNGHLDSNSHSAEGILSIEQAQTTIEDLKKENREQQTTIDELRKGLSKALESVNRKPDESITGNGENIKTTISNYENEIAKLQQKLTNANEEKEYYKTHYNNNTNAYQTTMNGGFSDRDDFGKELLQANKRKYQLEGKVRQLELELRDAQNTIQHLDRNLKSTEKYLWLEKERSATLEQERNGLNGELEWLRKENEKIKEQLDLALSVGSGVEGTPDSPRKDGEPGKSGHFFDELERVKKEYDVKISDILHLKNQVEWRLGEVTKNWNDAKWRVGELEASVAHKDYELDQSNNRIKQLESVLATPVTNMSEELNHLREEVRNLSEQKSKVEWKLGEVNQWWNDAKWRMGELEGEVNHKNHQLDEAHRRISEIQHQAHIGVPDDLRRELDGLRHDKGHLEWRVSELDKAWNDAKWRIGELEAELRHKNEHIRYLESNGDLPNLQRMLDELRDQKSKMEWRLGEVTQYWNDAKWRLGELQEHLNQKENQLKEAYSRIEPNRTGSPQTSERVLSQLSESFVIRKQPHGDRHRWNLVTWENINQRNGDFRRVWFDVNTDGANEVFLIGSFFNWECALVCERLPEDPNKRGIWVELLAGRHQFRFVRDGKWHTASNYPQEYNEFGGSNNWIEV